MLICITESFLKKQRSIADRIKSRRQRLDIINKKKENINNGLFKEYFDYSNPDTMIKRLKDASDKRNEDMIESINKKMCLKTKHFRLKKMKK